MPYRKWTKENKDDSEVGEESTDVPVDELYQDTSDMDNIISSVNELKNKIKTNAEIESTESRNNHIKMYLLDEEQAMKSINRRINILNNVLLYKFIQTEFAGDFDQLISDETDPLYPF
eukprot:317129_1